MNELQFPLVFIGFGGYCSEKSDLTEIFSSVYAKYNVASFPGPSRGGGERAWYTLHAHARGSP